MLALVLSLASSGCAKDADCVMAYRCGCDCCPTPEAMTKKQADAEGRKCAPRGPCGRIGCPDIACPALKPVVAVCKAGQCAAQAPDGGTAKSK